MLDSEFHSALAEAVNGSSDGFEMIVKQYSPLINKSSRLGNSLNEDLRQHILIKIAAALPKYKLGIKVK